MRPARAIPPKQAIKVVLSEDLQLHIGRGGWLRLDPRDGSYASAVIGALGRIAEDASQAATLERIAAAEQPIRIVKPGVATVPPNAWSRPKDLRRATAAGVPTGRIARDGTPVLGVGGGTESTISFDPADWPAACRHHVLHAALREASVDALGERAPPAAPPPPAKPLELLLSCQPRRDAGCLVFPYRLENKSDRIVFVMSGVAVEAAMPERRVEQELATVLLDADGDAVIGKLPPPPPLDRRLALPCRPLATSLSPGGVLEGRLTVAEPLAESSPLLPAEMPDGEAVEISGVVFAMAYWPQAGERRAVPFPGLPDSHDASALGSPVRVTQRFPVRGLRMLRRAGAERRSSCETPPAGMPAMLTGMAGTGV